MPTMPNRRYVAWNGLLLVVLVAAAALPGAPVAAQDRFNCEDFASQAEAQAELDSTLPDDPSGLDRDDDGIACESEFGLTGEDEAASAATGEDEGSRAGRDGAPASDSGAATDTNAPMDGSTAMSSPSASGDVPNDVLARVEGCAVVAISSHDVAAAGCPGGQSIVFRTPADAPPMKSTVIINPGGPMASDAEASAAATDVTGSRAAAHEIATSAHSRRSRPPDDRGESGTGKNTKGAKNAKADKKHKKDTSRKDRRKR
jgi:hypothetical protein